MIVPPLNSAPLYLMLAQDWCGAADSSAPSLSPDIYGRLRNCVPATLRLAQTNKNELLLLFRLLVPWVRVGERKVKIQEDM